MEFLSIVPHKKTNKEIVVELVEFLIQGLNESQGGAMLALMPAISIAKVKLSKLSAEDADTLVDKVHQVSALIEQETGILSQYHGAL